MANIEENLSKVRARVQAAEAKYGRPDGSVTLIAVSKTKSADLIKEAIDAQQTVFGESYVQEAITKQQALADYALEWHFVGPIQSNKTRLIAEHFDWVHSVDREKIARRLNDQRPADLPPMNIFLQVNISAEESKAGADRASLKTLVKSVLTMNHLKLCGLMAIPVKTSKFDEQRNAFKRLADLQQEINQEFNLALNCLSMGMSNDLEAAIAEGATHIRIGTDIFGAREYKAEVTTQ